MPQIISGPGLGLTPPQALYPASLYNAPYTAPTNQFDLKPAATLVIPAGRWIVSTAATVCAIQWMNPVTQQWTNLLGPGAAIAASIKSDGFNWRVANLSDSWYGALITGAGTNYVQATTTVTAGTGNSTWQPVIGGALGAFTVTAGGAGYSMPPNVFIPYPPYPGIPATAYATLTLAAVTSITIDQAGAGYLTAPPVVLVPNPFDPNYLNGSITANATATVALTGAGTLTGLLLVNAGQALTTAPTLTVNGAGSSATATTNPSTVVGAANAIITMQPDVG